MKASKKFFFRVLFVLLVVSGISGLCYPADVTTAYTRITMGGGQSVSGNIQMSDSMTQNAGSNVQTGTRFQVTSVKDQGEVSKVRNWKSY